MGNYPHSCCLAAFFRPLLPCLHCPVSELTMFNPPQDLCREHLLPWSALLLAVYLGLSFCSSAIVPGGLQTTHTLFLVSNPLLTTVCGPSLNLFDSLQPGPICTHFSIFSTQHGLWLRPKSWHTIVELLGSDLSMELGTGKA